MRIRHLSAIAALVLAGATIPTAAGATPTDEAEMSTTIEVVWEIPGEFPGYALWPQTYMPDGVPECSDHGYQIDEYKYGTQEVRDIVDALVATGILRSPADDSRVNTGNYRFVTVPPCEDVEPGPVEVAVPSPTVVPGTCEAVGTVTLPASAHYTVASSGPDNARMLTATGATGVVLSGQTVFGPYDLSKLTGAVCAGVNPPLPGTSGVLPGTTGTQPGTTSAQPVTTGVVPVTVTTVTPLAATLPAAVLPAQAARAVVAAPTFAG